MFFIAWLIDPLQLYRKSATLAPDMLADNMREQAPGIIRHYDFDSLILGSSELENTSAAEASQKLGGHFINLSITGGSYYERQFPLEMALRKNLRSVIYSLDDFYRSLYIDSSSYPAAQWIYLYDSNPINDLKRYATLKNFMNLFSESKGLRKTNLDRPNAWLEDPAHYRLYGGLDNLTDNLDNGEVNYFLRTDLPTTAEKVAGTTYREKHDESREKKSRAYLDDYFLKYVKANPQTTFYGVFPPYLRFVYAGWLRLSPEDFFLHQNMVRYLVDQTRSLPNLRLFGYEDGDFSNDIANYKDTRHYHPRLNSQMLDDMATGRHELTPENVEEYLEKCRLQAWNFDIEKLNAQAQDIMRKKGIEPLGN